MRRARAAHTQRSARSPASYAPYITISFVILNNLCTKTNGTGRYTGPKKPKPNRSANMIMVNVCSIGIFIHCTPLPAHFGGVKIFIPLLRKLKQAAWLGARMTFA